MAGTLGMTCTRAEFPFLKDQNPGGKVSFLYMKFRLRPDSCLVCIRSQQRTKLGQGNYIDRHTEFIDITHVHKGGGAGFSKSESPHFI